MPTNSIDVGSNQPNTFWDDIAALFQTGMIGHAPQPQTTLGPTFGTVETTSVPGGAAGNDGLVPISASAVNVGYLWAPSSQVYPTSGPPDDSILGPNYTPQSGDTPCAWDPAAQRFYIRSLSSTTNAPQWFWANSPPAVINGGN